jgi:predicted dehydrogenase
MKKINVAIIGCGRMGQRHAMAYSKHPKINIVGFFDTNKKLTKKLASSFKKIAYESIEEIMNNSSIGAISICTINSQHFDLIKKGIKSKKHILVEKPIVTTKKECIEIKKIIKKSKSRIMVGHTHRFFPCNVELRKQLQLDKIGKLKLINTFDYIPGRTKGQKVPTWIKNLELSGGGVFMTDLIHTVDKITWLTNSEIEKVYCPFMSNFITSSNVEDSGTVFLWLKNGMIASCTHTCPSPGSFDMSTKIIGEKGEISLKFADELKIIKKSHLEINFPYKGNYDKHSDQGFYNEISEFVDSIIDDREPSVNHDDGIKAVEVILGIYESFKRKQPVKIS